MQIARPPPLVKGTSMIRPVFRSLSLVSIAVLALTAACSKAPDNSAATTDTTGNTTAAVDSKRLMPTDPDTKSLYIQSCYSCHGTGAAGAPRTGNSGDWAPRLAKGMDTLLDHTINGFNGMPPLGMCMDCGEEEFVALINFMAGQE